MSDTAGGDPGNRERIYRIEPERRERAYPKPEQPGEEARREVIEALRAEGEVPSTPAEPAPPPPPTPAPPTPEPDPAERFVPRVQQVLAEGLYETYAQLPPALQQRFKSEGERTASAVAKLLTETKVRVAKIIALIRRWLSIIPGVNRYYLEQEAKLKADAMLELKQP